MFQLASLSKPLGATVIAHQVGQNAISWDTPVVYKLPWFALSDPVVTPMVTIGDMYSHRSGLPDHAGDELEDLGYDRRYVLDHLRALPLAPFRISYAYTNYGVTAAPTRWPRPRVSRGRTSPPMCCTGRSAWRRRVRGSPTTRRGKTGRWAIIHVDGEYAPDYVRDADAQAPAGGVSSSVNDMTHWMAMVLGNGTFEGRQIVDAKALLPAVTPQIVSSPAAEPAMRSGFYGYGFNVGTTSAARTQLSHSGAFELGAGTNFLMIPSADVAIVALTNATPTGAAEALTAEFADLVQFGEIREDWYQALPRRLRADGGTGGIAGRQIPTSQTRTGATAFVLRRQLCQRLLGAGAGHRSRRQARPGAGAQTGCSAGTLGRQRLHLQHGDRELAAGQHLQGDVRP